MINEIRSYPFDSEGLEQVHMSSNGKNWPVVYLIHDDENLYIGETTSIATRMKQHLNNDKMILSILVDTFISKISFPMQPGPEIGSISDA